MEFYQKNPSALASLRGTVYEEKIIDLIKTKAKVSKKEISKEEAEKILKEHQKQDHNHEHDHDNDNPEEKKPSKPAKIEKKSEPSASKKPSAKKVSKK
jgi:trigger factor